MFILTLEFKTSFNNLKSMLPLPQFMFVIWNKKPGGVSAAVVCVYAAESIRM